MPTYEYACTNPDCGNRFELVQSFTDPSASACPVCGGPVRKVFSAVGVVFKGSGFYRTDNRPKDTSDSGSGDTSGKKDGKAAKESTSGSKESSGAKSSSSGSKDSSSSGSSSSGSSSSGSSSSGSSSSGSSSSGSSGGSSGKAAASA